MSQNDTAANDQVVADTTTPDSAPEEIKESEVAEGLEDSAFDDVDLSDVEEPTETEDEAEPKADDTAKPSPSEETETSQQPRDDKPATPEDEWSSLAGSSRDRFQQAINERNELRRQVEELTAKKAQFATEQELLNEINPDTGYEYTPQEIERISWQQTRETQAQRVNEELYQAQVQQNQQSINDEADRVSREFPLVDPRSKDYVPEIGAQYAEALNDSLVYVLPTGQQANRSTLLANGINPDTQATLVGYTTSPYKLAKLASDSFSRAKAQGETLGQAKAQQATERMLANADAPSGNSQATSKDADLDDFDKGWND